MSAELRVHLKLHLGSLNRWRVAGPLAPCSLCGWGTPASSRRGTPRLIALTWQLASPQVRDLVGSWEVSSGLASEVTQSHYNHTPCVTSQSRGQPGFKGRRHPSGHPSWEAWFTVGPFLPANFSFDIIGQSGVAGPFLPVVGKGVGLVGLAIPLGSPTMRAQRRRAAGSHQGRLALAPPPPL